MSIAFFLSADPSSTFGFDCPELPVRFSGFPSPEECQQAITAHADSCERCFVFSPAITPDQGPQDGVLLPDELVNFMLSEAEIHGAREGQTIPALAPSDALSRALIAAAFVGVFASIQAAGTPAAATGTFEEAFYDIALLAERAQRAGRSVCWAG